MGCEQVMTSVVSAKLGGDYMLQSFVGTYSVTEKDGALSMTCHYTKKRVWWVQNPDISLEMSWNETVTVSVRLSGTTLTMQGIPCERQS